MYCHFYLITNKLNKLIRIDCLKYIRGKYDLNQYFIAGKYSDIGNPSENNLPNYNNEKISSKKIQINKPNSLNQDNYCSAGKALNDVFSINSILSEGKVNNLESNTIYPKKLISNVHNEHEENKNQMDDRGIIIESFMESPNIKNKMNHNSLNNTPNFELNPEENLHQDVMRHNNKSFVSDLTSATPSAKKLLSNNQPLKMKDEQEFEIVEEVKEFDISVNNSKENNHHGYVLASKTNRSNKSVLNKLSLQKTDITNTSQDNEITLRDYIELTASEACKYDKRGFWSLLLESFLLKHKLLNLFFKTSLIDPLWKRILLLLTFITLASAFNALLFTDDLIEFRSMHPKETRVRLKYLCYFLGFI
jgi:hypothetical protein